MAFRYWQDLTSPDFGDLDGARAVAVLPLCATEQHGPHLPTGTDTMIAEGLTGEVARRFKGDFDLIFLPALAVGASQEHARFAGTLSVSTPALIEQISAIGRLGLPQGAVDDNERDVGIHGGFVETSLMLHFRPDLVRMDQAADFASLQSDLAARYQHLRAHGPVGFGWLAGDLNPAGAVGNAASANAEAGRDISAHQAEAFIALAGEISQSELASTFT
jgi:creatinine amidohydrolase